VLRLYYILILIVFAQSVVAGTVLKTANGHLADISSKLDSVAVTGTFWQAIQPVSGTVTCSGVGGGGDATAANQATGNISLSAINDKLPALSGGMVPVDGSGATQPISAAALPLPSGAATSAKQDTANSSLASIDSKLTSVPVTGAFYQATQPVSAAALPLPSGAATSAKQDTGNTSLSNIDGKLPALGQALAAGSVPVILPAATITALTPPASITVSNFPSSQAVTGTFWQATQPVSGTFWQATQPVSAASLPLPSGASTAVKQPALGTAGTASADVITVQGIAAMTALKVDGSGVTQPVSGTFWQVTQPVSIASMPSTPVTGTFWQATQPVSQADGVNVTFGSKADAKSTATDTTAITAMSVLKQISASVQAPPSQAVTNAGIFAVQAAESDGANVTLGAKGDAKSAATDTTAVTIMSVLKQISASAQAPPSQAVTNTGTFATQSTLAAETTKVIGTVNIAAAQSVGLSAGSALVGKMGIDQTTPGTTNKVSIGTDGTVTVNALTNASVVKAQLQDNAGTAITLGQKAMTSSVPVVLASDQTVIPASQSGTWTMQPGNTPNTSPWLFSIHDGTNKAKVTAASTAAAAADLGVVVSTSPNGGNPCQNPSATLVSANGATSGTAAVQIVALSGSTKIYICSLTVIGVSGTSPTFSLVQGTGSNCATGQTIVVRSWTTTAGSLYAYANPVAVGAAGNALCYLNTGTTPVQNYTLTYVQQ
jgi:hypothetical protein